MARLLLLACLIAAACDAVPDGPRDVRAPDGAPADAVGPDTPAEVPPARFDECVAGQPPDAACYAARRDPSSEEVALATELAARFMALHAPDELAWNWEEGVLGLALLELHRVTGAPELATHVGAWLDHHIAHGYRLVWSDSCPPAASAAVLFGTTGEARYRTVVEDVLRYLEAEAPRSPHGGISHFGTVFPDAPALWVDSLFMVGMPLLRWAEVASDTRALALAGEQLRIFADVLQRPAGFYTHAWGVPEGLQEEGVFWARGNAWVTVAGHEYLRLLAERGEADAAVSDALDRQVVAVVASQDPATGLWWTVPDRPGATYLETSGSALFAYGLARGWRYGLRGDEALPVVRRAVDGLRGQLRRDEEGRPFVTGTSVGTSVGDFAYYAGIAREDDVPYGVGAAILLLVESSGLP